MEGRGGTGIWHRDHKGAFVPSPEPAAAEGLGLCSPASYTWFWPKSSEQVRMVEPEGERLTPMLLYKALAVLSGPPRWWKPGLVCIHGFCDISW